MAEIISTATTSEDYEAFARLIREYVAWSRDRYGHEKWFVDATFGHQSLDAELETLSNSYGAPKGRTLLARQDGQVRGCGAYRKLSDEVCEMKRLFVPERFQGSGIGRRLCQALIAAAAQDGFALMRLDTGNLLTEAIQMYRSMGFRNCAPYNEYPRELMPHLMFMERDLDSPGP